MFKFAKKIKRILKMKKGIRQGIAYGIVAFLVMQCYVLPFASGDNARWEEIATIGDATWTDAVQWDGDSVSEDAGASGLSLSEAQISVMSAVSDSYYIAPDTSNAFVAYAMGAIARGSGRSVNNQCAVYASRVIYGYYGAQAPVAGSTVVSQISNTLSADPNWKCVYADAACFPQNQTEAQYDAIFDSLTNVGDIVCFVDKKLDNYVHCGIAGGGTALIGHLYSSGWDSLRAAYYIDNAVDTRKECSGMIVYRYQKAVQPGTLRLCKNYDENIYRLNPQAYDISGANYGVFKSRDDAESMQNVQGYCYIEPAPDGGLALDNISANARTQPDGGGTEVKFEPGTYYVREVKAPIHGGWLLDESVYETQILAGTRTTLGLPRDQYANPIDLGSNGHLDQKVLGPEQPKMGRVTLKKSVTDVNQPAVEQNGSYSFEGIEYTVYAVSGNNQINIQNPVGVFSLNASGDGMVASDIYNTTSIGTSYMTLPIGWYMLQETRTNASMQLNPSSQWFEVTAMGDELQNLSAVDEPVYARADLVLRKYGEDQTAVQGAKYVFKYYKTCMDENPEQKGIQAARTWIFQTDEQGEIRYSKDVAWFVEGDSFYTDKDGNCVMPAGTLTIQEIEAPDQYVIDETVYVKKITPGDTLAVLSTDKLITVIEDTLRGDLEFRKVTEDGKPLANVQFRITDDKGESHIVWTDAEGYYSTSASYIAHTENTNADEPGTGIWFGALEPDDTRGALPYGIYKIEELRCDANKNKYKTMNPQIVEVKENKKQITLGDFVNYSFPAIRTKASIFEMPELLEVGSIVSCVDVVSLKNLEIGHTYTIYGEPHWKEDGTSLEMERYISGSVTFEATQTDAQVEVEYDISLSEELYDSEIVFFEYMEDAAYPGETVAQHADIDDKNQTIQMPAKPVRPFITTSESTTQDTSLTTTEIPVTETPLPDTRVAGAYEEKTETQPENRTTVKTGDDSQVFLALLIASTTFLGIGMAVIGRVKKKKRGDRS